MTSTLCKRSISGSKQQEIKMREVMGGLEEIATMLSYNPWPGDFEIIAIYPAEQDDAPSSEKTVIVSSVAMSFTMIRSSAASSRRMERKS